MNNFEITLLISTFLLGIGFWSWCLFRAYPIYLDRQVRRGKSWVYLPKFWKGSQKSKVQLFTKFLKWTMVGALASVIFVFIQNVAFPILLNVGLSAGVSTAIVHLSFSKLIRIRFVQQEKFYFDKLTNQFRIYEEQGRAVSELEVRNLVSWEFQNSLRRADEAGELLHVLRLNSQIQR